MRRVGGAAAATLALAAACSSTGSSPATQRPSTSQAPQAAQPREAAQWPTYHGDNSRRGVGAAAALAPPLKQAWSVHLDAAAYAQPIVVDGVVIAATENDTVYAVDVATGRTRWRRHLATPTRQSQLPCGNIDPSGITGSPAYDAATHEVFVATESGDARHSLFALDARTGATRWQRDLDVLSQRDRRAQQERGALLTAFGRVYVPFGGRYGDCGNYVGYLAGVSTGGTGSVATYAVPTAREAGMWAPPGPVIGPGGDIYVATGNGAEVGGRYDDSDSVIRLTPTLRRVALFSPSTWRQDNAQDLDLGSMSPAPVGGDLVIAGKRGVVYLLHPTLGGVGGQAAALDGCAAYGGAAVQVNSGQADAGHAGTVLLPCADGVRALRVQGTAMKWLWHNASLEGSPTIAGDAGYAFSGSRLVEFDLRTGHARARIDVGHVTRFTTPVPVAGLVVVATKSKLVAVSGRG